MATSPFLRRMADECRKCSSTGLGFLQPDGSYRAAEVPGPADYARWYSCWKVYSNILLMLRFEPESAADEPKLVATPAALECYLEAFRQLAAENVESWHLCCKAEDRACAEHMPRVKRQLERESGKATTWSEVFVAVARDDRYWDKEVRRPALTFVARGGRNKPSSEMETTSLPQLKVIVERTLLLIWAQGNDIAFICWI